MRLSLWILLCALPLITRGQDEPARATWVWKGWETISSAERQTDFFKFCENARLRDLYICFPPQKLVTEDSRKSLAAFVKEAHARSMRIHLLAGSVEMAYSPHALLKIIDQVSAYNENVPDESKLDGLHLDIEPHTMGALWTQDDKLRNRFMETMKKYADKFHEKRGKMTLGLDIPVGFADDPPLLDAMLDATDYVAIMDYRDTPGPIIFGAEEIVEAARKKGKKVIIGVETQAPNKKYGVIPMLTFWDEGYDRMEKVLGQVHDHFKADPAFAGFAIHSYEAYRTLEKGPRIIADTRTPPTLPTIPIPRASGMKIDGDLAEWKARPSTEIKEARQVVYGKNTWKTPDDLSATCWLGWDEENFYLAIDVLDDAVIQPFEPRKMVNGDHIELWLDLDYEKNKDAGNAVSGVYQIGISPGNFSDHPAGVYDWLPGGLLKNKQGDLEIKAVKTPKGYAVELRIPWALLGEFRPAAGKPLRLNIDPSDTDGAEKPLQDALMSTSHFREWGNPKTFRMGEFGP